MSQFIVYACPEGPLAEQIEAYLEESKRLCGENAAHNYMPHCTLTGFFEDEKSAIAHYTDTLTEVLYAYPSTTAKQNICIKRLTFNDNWHGLELEAKWLKQLIIQFAEAESSQTREQPLRLKDWLHLSLAYDFQQRDGKTLKQLAIERINVLTAVSWELKFYERISKNDWVCHACWKLSETF